MVTVVGVGVKLGAIQSSKPEIERAKRRESTTERAIWRAHNGESNMESAKRRERKG